MLHVHPLTLTVLEMTNKFSFLSAAPPKITTELQNSSCMTDEKMIFTVEVEGMPVPEVKWYVQDVIIYLIVLNELAYLKVYSLGFVAYFKVMAQHSLADTEENHAHTQDSQAPDQDLNLLEEACATFIIIFQLACQATTKQNIFLSFKDSLPPGWCFKFSFFQNLFFQLFPDFIFISLSPHLTYPS